MEWIQVTGRTVAEAIEQALDELGVDEGDIEYEVLEEPKRGLFGLRATGVARVRARVKPISREKPDRRRRSGGSREGRSRSGGGGGSREGREPRPPREPRRDGGGGGGGGGRPAKAPAAVAEADVDDLDDSDEIEDDAGTETAGGPGGSSAGPRKRNRKRRRGPRRPAGTAGGAEDRGSGRPHREEESSVTSSDVSIEEQAELAAAFTKGLLERFGLPATVSSEPDGDDDVMVKIEGDDLGVLIGPRAATLDAVQELVRTTVQRRIGGHGARVHVDVGGYRARRQAALAEFARQTAQKVLESGRPKAFEPMSPGDRKVVHDTVNDIEGVQTISEGEEPRRRVVIKAL